MTVAIITDQHLNGRKGSEVFWNYFKKFYDEIFFPTLEKEGIKTLINLGDTFDDRKSISFNTWSIIREYYFKRLEDLGVEMHMLVGNHDVSYKNTNRINSPELLLKDFNNVKIYSTPQTIKIEGVNILLLPWINSENYDETMKQIKETPAKIAMGHLELNGFEMSPGMKHEGGMNPDLFVKFKQVFSGHFHHKSTNKNITYLGNPYQMYWNDYKDERGFHLYEPKSNKLKRIKNPFEIFTKIYYNETTKSHLKVHADECKNTFIKIIVEDKRNYLEFEKYINNIFALQPHEVKIIETLIDDKVKEKEENLEIKDTLSLLNEYVDEIELTVDKNKLKNILKTLYIESCEAI